MNIRALKANEIECRTQSVKKTAKGIGAIILLYKDARCDMKILDEVFGSLGWEREHQLVNGNLFCTVRVWDKEKAMWISKQDVGTESNTEKEKGQASDSFKRACFNLGIGRELYTAPFVWINLQDGEHSEYNGKVQCNAKFAIKSIAYNEEKEIIGLEIADSKGNVRYKLGAKTPLEATGAQENNQTSKHTLSEPQVARAIAIGKKNGIDLATIKKQITKDYKVTDIAQLNKKQYDELCERLEKAGEKSA